MVLVLAAFFSHLKNLSQSLRSIPQVSGVTKKQWKPLHLLVLTGNNRHQCLRVNFHQQLSSVLNLRAVRDGWFALMTRGQLKNWQKKDGHSDSYFWWKKPYVTWDIYIYTLGFRTLRKRRVQLQTRGLKTKPEVFQIHEIQWFDRLCEISINPILCQSLTVLA